MYYYNGNILDEEKDRHSRYQQDALECIKSLSTNCDTISYTRMYDESLLVTTQNLGQKISLVIDTKGRLEKA